MIEDLRMVKMEICGKMFDVVPLELYQKNPNAYVQGYTAIESADGRYALPIRGANDQRPGIYVTNCIAEERISGSMDDYDMTKSINLSDSKTIGELLQKQDAVRNIEHEILTDVDNIFTPKIGNNDSPAIKGLKQAVIKKHIDLDKYEPRFGSNYNNDKRLLNKDKISLQMMVRVCDALDIKATLTLEDKDSDIANPMGEKIEIELTKGGFDDDQSE